MSANLVWSRKTLANGLTVLLYPRQSANTVQLSLAVKYGSNQEPAESAGIAHFLEHMLAGGSERRIQQSRSIEDFGGVLDFYTDREQVLGTMDVVPQQATAASEVLSELFFDGCFELEKFEVERKIILNELAEVTDDPVVKIEELLLQNLFKQHPIRRPVGGYPKTVKQLTLNQLIEEHQANYIPQNMILILSGSMPQKTLSGILEEFGSKHGSGGSKRQRQDYVEPAKAEAFAVEEKAGITQTYLSLGAQTVCAGHKDAPALDLIGILLGGGTSSRLFIELREKHAVTYDVNSAHNKGSDFGYLSISCAVNNCKATKARQLILKELENLRANLVPPEELERAKQIMLGGVLRGMDDSHDTLEIISYMEMQFGTEFALRDYVAKIRGVTSRDIQKAAAQHLAEDNLGTAILKPLK
jgi:predicted Zn-dependent peptidase